MRFVQSILVTILCIVAFTASADSDPPDTSVADNYPGWNSSRTAVDNVAQLLVQRAAKAYFKVYGHWPASWQAVVDCGLFQATLVGPRLQPIDPDDKQLDFFMDVVYEHGNPPIVHTPLLHETLNDST